jgi:hypothetical protein
LGRVRAVAGTEPHCFRYQDADADGEPEWLALVHQPGTPSRTSGFVLDGVDVHALYLPPPEPGDPDYGLGQYPTCEVEVRDVNADGRPEVAVFGHAEENETLLHLYVWEGGEYRLLGSFSGDGGVRFVDADGDLAEEVLEGYREDGAPNLTWYVVFTWDGQTYGWTSDRWGWFYLDRPHAYPTHTPEYAVVSFYLALDDRDLPGAYALMSPDAQASRPYEDWARGFATMVQVHVGSVHQIPGVGDANNARVAAMVISWDNVDGRVMAKVWDAEWSVVRAAGGWRLEAGSMDLLDTWEAEYWP